MDSTTTAEHAPLQLQRSVSQQSASSTRSYRSTTVRGRSRRLLSQPSSASSSVAPSDKSLTSFPSFSPEGSNPNRSRDDHDPERLKTATQESENKSRSNRAFSGKAASIVESLTDRNESRDALFQDSPLAKSVPGALHHADDKHIERLVARQGAVALVRQLAEDVARRDSQIATLRRRADERERALKRILRECGLSNLDLETRLRAVEAEMKKDDELRGRDDELSDLMSVAMQDKVSESIYGEAEFSTSTLRGSTTTSGASDQQAAGKGTMRGWKDYIWGGTAKKSSCGSSVNGDGNGTVATAIRNADKRPTLQDDLFEPPSESQSTRRSSSRASSIYSGYASDRKDSVSLASKALRLVAGGSTPVEPRGRAASNSDLTRTSRAVSAMSGRTARSATAAPGTVGPKALMAMRRATPAANATPTSSKAQAQELWGSMAATPPSAIVSRQESSGPVEMDAILPPESQPPTLNQTYNNFSNNKHLTDRFGFIYDQRRKKRQREATQISGRLRQSSRAEMLSNGRNGISPNLLDDLPSPKSLSSDGRPLTPGSMEERLQDEGKPKRWQDYLKIATFPTELLSHTPSVSASTIEVLEAVEGQRLAEQEENEPTRIQSIKPTDAGLVPLASPTTAVDNETNATTDPDVTLPMPIADDTEPVKLLLQQLSEVHDSLQRDKTVRWNDFLRRVRAERKREGEAAVAAAAAVAEARYERPAVILPETRVADGEMIGISNLGNKGKVGRAKWNEFKTLVLGGIPVAYRAKVWSECSGAMAMRVPGYYDDLVAQSGAEDDPTVVGQIQMDIHRTLTDNIFFREGPGVEKLNEVLVAYSRRNHEVGYCQGMNLITANLLLITPSAEDAFWILASIVENILPQGYYDQSLISSRADQQVLRQYVSTVLPKLSAHLDSLSIELEALTFQWFLSVFTDCLSAEALFRVWDVVLCTNDGSTFLFQVALALLKLNEQNLLKCETPASVYTYINHQMTEHAISIDGLMQASEGLRRVVRREEVEQKRSKIVDEERSR